MTKTVLNTKISKVENKIPDVQGWVKKTDYDAAISEIEKKKYFCTSDCNTFTSNIIGAKIKQKKVVNESNISDLV